MVDFNSSEIFNIKNQGDLLVLVVLGRRDELLNTFQLWQEKRFNNSQRIIESKLRACLFTTYLEICEPLERKLEKRQEDLDFLKKTINSTEQNINDSDLIKSFRIINKVLDELNLIKIDTKKEYDRTSFETENEEKGL